MSSHILSVLRSKYLIKHIFSFKSKRGLESCIRKKIDEDEGDGCKLSTLEELYLNNYNQLYKRHYGDWITPYDMCKHGHFGLLVDKLKRGLIKTEFTIADIKLICTNLHDFDQFQYIYNLKKMLFVDKDLLLLSCRSNCVEIVKLLLSQRSPIKLPTYGALENAVKFGNEKVIKYLLENGVGSVTDRNLYDLSLAHPTSQIFRLLESMGAPGKKPFNYTTGYLHSELQTGDPELIKQFNDHVHDHPFILLKQYIKQYRMFHSYDKQCKLIWFFLDYATDINNNSIYQHNSSHHNSSRNIMTSTIKSFRDNHLNTKDSDILATLRFANDLCKRYLIESFELQTMVIIIELERLFKKSNQKSHSKYYHSLVKEVIEIMELNINTASYQEEMIRYCMFRIPIDAMFEVICEFGSFDQIKMFNEIVLLEHQHIEISNLFTCYLKTINRADGASEYLMHRNHTRLSLFNISYDLEIINSFHSHSTKSIYRMFDLLFNSSKLSTCKLTQLMRNNLNQHNNNQSNNYKSNNSNNQFINNNNNHKNININYYHNDSNQIVYPTTLQQYIWNCVMHALINDDVEMISTILDLFPTGRNQKKEILMNAFYEGATSICKYLIDRGASIYGSMVIIPFISRIMNRVGQMGSIEILQQLTRVMTTNIKSSKWLMVVFEGAIEYNRQDLIDFILEKLILGGANVDTPNFRLLFINAIERRELEVLKFLVFKFPKNWSEERDYVIQATKSIMTKSTLKFIQNYYQLETSKNIINKSNVIPLNQASVIHHHRHKHLDNNDNNQHKITLGNRGGVLFKKILKLMK